MDLIQTLESFNDGLVVTMALAINQKLTALLGLGVFIYVAVKVALKMSGNSDNTYVNILTKPIIIMIIAATFSIDTINIFDATLDFINGSVREAITQVKEDPVGYRAKMLNIETLEKRLTTTETVNKDILAEMEVLIAETDKLRQEHEFKESGIKFQRVTGSFTSLISWLAMTAISVFRAYYMAILLMMLPIALALSLFPTFDDIIKQWAHHYISVSLWLSAIYLVDTMVYLSYEMLASSVWNIAGSGSKYEMIKAFLINPSKTTEDITKAFIVSNLMSFISALSYFMIPKFTSWIVGKASSTASAMSGVTGVVQTAAIAAVALATGGAGAVAAGGASAAGSSGGGSGAAATFKSVSSPSSKSKSDE